MILSKRCNVKWGLIISLGLFFLSACNNGEQDAAAQQARLVENFNQGWKFSLGDEEQAWDTAYDDSQWRSLNLPHDWSIEGEFSAEHPARPEGGGLPTGKGWYRKTFTMPAEAKEKQVYIDFDGVYRNSEVWINGHYLGKRPNGYIGFRYDLTPYLTHEPEQNVLAVKVDNSEQPNSRWYTGSGIYRNVWLVTTGTVHVDHWGTFLTTPEVSGDSAKVKLDIRLRNKSSYSSASEGQTARASVVQDNGGNGDQNVGAREVSLETLIYDADGKEIASQEVVSFTLSDSLATLSQEFKLTEPELWSHENPYMYRAVTLVTVNDEITDRYETPFGVRSFEFDSEQGFFLNGEPVKLLGVCNHHDLGALGAAVNTRAMERQLEIMKEMGANALRTAHNPPAPELLDLCDKMGFIVMDESFDVWKKRKVKNDEHLSWDDWHQRDLEAMVKRDRNHPSVIMWSIGNEIREQFDSTGITITRELTDIVKKLDTTRPVASALTENEPEKNFIYQSGALDLLGFNYKHEAYEDLPNRFPGEKFIATETSSALATRGHYDMPSDSIRRWPVAHNVPLVGDNPDHTVSAYDHVSAYWGSTHEETWKVVKKLDHMAGLFIWTGFDYLGEPIPYPWPARSSYFGVVDLAGFPKDSYYMYQSEWRPDEPVLHVFPHWNWEAGKTVDVWAYYNNADEVELFLNGESQGTRKKEGEELHVMWRLTYEPGTLEAVSRKNGEEVLRHQIKTAGEPARIELQADRDRISADGRDLSFVTVRILDEEGNLVPDADNMVNFDIEGAGFIAGVDNGYQASMEPFKADYRKTFNGMCLAIVQSNGAAGSISLKARAEGLEEASLTINSQ